MSKKTKKTKAHDSKRAEAVMLELTDMECLAVNRAHCCELVLGESKADWCKRVLLAAIHERFNPLNLDAAEQVQAVADLKAGKP